MAQSRKQSLMEAILNAALAFSISVAANAAILPLFGYRVRLWESVGMVAIFTVISIVRTYYMRRMFEWYAQVKEDFKALSSLT